MTTTTALPIPAKFDAKETDTPVQAAAKVWLAAKVIEDAAKDAKKDRSGAEEDLTALLGHGGTVVLNGNTTYTWDVSERERENAAKLLAAAEVLHPGLTATLDRLKAEDKARDKGAKLYATPFTVCSLKLAGR